VTGLDYSVSSLKKAGERIFQLERLMNVRLGVSSSQDTLPSRILNGMENPEKHRESKALYYQLRHWGTDGAPDESVLETLRLSSEEQGEKTHV
jgi:aldehyde:ferredoxin oxidoreductase